MTIYIDTDATHDHTYYGNGCYEGTGSSTPCSSHLIETIDNEEQEIGTYYHFQAITSGSGGGTTADDANAPDSFCPLGWQLPYSGRGGDYYDKSKTWNHLFKSYGLHIGDGTATDATKVKSYPFSYVYSGYYVWSTGRLYDQSIRVLYWSSTVVSSTVAYYLYTWSSGVRPAGTNSKAGGSAVRCVLIFSIHSSTAR